MSSRITITGSSGKLGGGIAKLISSRGIPLNLILRDAARAPILPGVASISIASYDDFAASTKALEGTDILLMVSGHEGLSRMKEHTTFINAAISSGVKHVVYTSIMGCSADCTFTLGHDHHHTEELIKASGMQWTFLRDCFYADIWPHFVGEDGIIRGPAGDGVIAPVAQQDIVEAASSVLLSPGLHVNKTYTLTGPDAMSLSSMAVILSKVLGRSISYYNESVEEAYLSRVKYDVPKWQVDAWVSTYTAIAEGQFAEVSRDVELLTGKAAMSLEECLATSISK